VYLILGSKHIIKELESGGFLQSLHTNAEVLAQKKQDHFFSRSFSILFTNHSKILRYILQITNSFVQRFRNKYQGMLSTIC
jgi:hypothetical protein